jgi:glutaredoxin-related protein
MPLANAIGIYLLAGTVLMGMSLIVKAGWLAAGKIKPPNMGKYEKLYVAIGMALGVLFWPLILIGLTIGWRMRRRKMQRWLGYCEHATAFEPICGPCSRDIKKESDIAALRYVVGEPPEDIKARIAQMDMLCHKAIAFYIKGHPECPKCGKSGTLSQYLGSIWVKCANCGRRTFTPDPSISEEVDTVPGWLDEGQTVEARSFYDCSACGVRFEGFPTATNAEGRPLCVACSSNR